MAKFNVSALLANIEKIVLALCVLVAGTSVIYYLTVSSQTMEINGTQVPSSDVDKELLRLAKSTAEHTQKVDPLPAIPNYVAQLDRLQNPDLAQYAILDPNPPIVPLPEKGVGPTTSEVARPKLADLGKAVPPVGRPLVKVSPEMRKTEPPSDRLAAHVTAVFPVGDVTKAWTDALRNSIVMPNILVLGVEVQVQELQADGNWSEPHPVVAATKLPLDNTGQPIPAPEIPEFNGENGKDVQDAIAKFTSGSFDMAAAEPDYWDILGPDRQWISWRVNLPVTELNTPDAMAVPGQPGQPGQAMPIGLAQPNQPKPQPAMGNMPVPPGAPNHPLPGLQQEVLTPTLVQPWPNQIAAGKFQIWFHDNAIENLKVYRYRMRLTLLNPLYSHPLEAANPEDANVKAIYSPWSEWSAAINAPRETEMFLTGSFEQQNIVTATVFARSLGQRVRRSFNVQLGENIGQKMDVEVGSPDQPGQMVHQDVDFSTGSMLIAVDWNRTVYRPAITIKSPEIVMMDEKGNLHTRMMELDRSSIRLHELQLEIHQPTPPPPAAKPASGGKQPRPAARPAHAQQRPAAGGLSNDEDITPP